MKPSPIRIDKTDINRRTVEQTVNGLTPATVANKPYFSVEISGLRYPVKQVIATVTGAKPHEFLTLDACRVLEGLGYRIRFHRPSAPG